MKKQKISFLASAIAFVLVSTVIFGLDFFGSNAKALEVIDPWDFSETGNVPKKTVTTDTDNADINKKLSAEDAGKYIWNGKCTKKFEMAGETAYLNQSESVHCCDGLIEMPLLYDDTQNPYEGDNWLQPNSQKQWSGATCISCDLCQPECDYNYQFTEYDSTSDAYTNPGLSLACLSCLNRQLGNVKKESRITNLSLNEAFLGKGTSFGTECTDRQPTVFRCSSSEEDCKDNKKNSCIYPMTSVNSSGISVKSSSGKEAQLRKSLDEALGKLGPELDEYLKKLEGLNDKEFKKLLKKLNPDLADEYLSGVSGFSTIGDNGENITIVNEDHWAVKKEGELANILAHEIAHFHRYELGQRDSRFAVAWHQVAGDVYDSSLAGKSTWPDGSKSKNGCVNAYACSDLSGQEDTMETLRRAIKDPDKFKSLFLDSNSASYDARFKEKLELLARFGFIANSQFNAILCIGK